MSIEETPPLAEVQDRFRFWRKHKPHPNAYIPKDLWRQAEDLAKKHGVLAVAKALDLNSTQLHNRIGGLKPRAKAKPKASKTETGHSLSPKVIEVASINISAADLAQAESHIGKNPNAVLTMNNGSVLSFYQPLGLSELTALINTAGGLRCSN